MTVKQKQCLLEYLGYYNPENSNGVNNVDGLWGIASETATKAFQRNYGLIADGIFGPLTEQKIKEVIAMNAPLPVNWEQVKYFGRAEFRCNCNGKYCDGFPAEMDGKLMKVADRVRGNFGAEAFVSSGVRCNQHNANVGGVSNSRHLYGKAMDFCISGKNGAEVLEYVLQQPEISYAYNIDGTYIHMDVE
ncbi:MAG: peptidoglycan-binding protein [Oscillospiraceae bacterium]|nr:peptidoglycan-binding protein [Oscillospiraceae bacterium]